MGTVSIPLSFDINSNPIIVWLGNALGSFISAYVVIFVANKITGKKMSGRMKNRRFTKKIVTVFEEGEGNKKVVKARVFINKHGLRIFAFLCPIFPGAFISTTAVYILDLDKKIYKFWLTLGIFFASGLYVFTYWHTFIR